MTTNSITKAVKMTNLPESSFFKSSLFRATAIPTFNLWTKKMFLFSSNLPKLYF
jgi:hypothetical protein